MTEKNQAEPKKTGKRKGSIGKILLCVLALLLVAVFLYVPYTKTHYKNVF